MAPGTTWRFVGGGATPSDYSQADNWEADTSTAGTFQVAGQIPTNSTNNTVIIARGTSDITAGLAQSGVSLGKLVIANTFSKSIGSASSALALGTVNETVVEGRGGFYKLSGTLTKVKAKGGGAGKMYLAGGAVTDLLVNGMDFTVEGGCDVTNARIQNVRDYSFETDATDIARLETIRSSGKTNSRNVTTYEGSDSSFHTTRGTSTIGDGGTVSLWGGTTLRIASDMSSLVASTGAVDVLTVGPGSKFDPTGAKFDFTISQLYEYAGSMVNDDPENITLTITARESFGGGNFPSLGGGSPI